MSFLTDNHLFRIGLIVIGVAVTPFSAHFVNNFVVGGALTPVFEQITTLAWLNLCFTTFIPFVLLSVWGYLTKLSPQICPTENHLEAHSVASLVTAVCITFLTVWQQVTFWKSTDPDSVAGFIYAPFAILSIEALLYVVVYSLAFRIAKL